MPKRVRVTVTLPSYLVAAATGDLSAYVERAVLAQTLRDAGVALTRWRGATDADIEELTEVFGEEVA